MRLLAYPITKRTIVRPSTKIEPLDFDMALERPCTKTVLETPCTKVVLERPCTKTTLETPCTKTPLERPCTKLLWEAPVRSEQLAKRSPAKLRVWTKRASLSFVIDSLLIFQSVRNALFLSLRTNSSKVNRFDDVYWFNCQFSVHFCKDSKIKKLLFDFHVTWSIINLFDLKQKKNFLR